MKNIKKYTIACIAFILLAACSDHNDDEHIYKQEVTLPSTVSEQLVRINSLSASIDTVKCTVSWLIVEPQPYYSSGSPEVKVRSTVNTNLEERSCDVTITATSGDIVVLTVIQQGTNNENNEETGIDDSHGVPTDKPAYSRQR